MVAGSLAAALLLGSCATSLKTASDIKVADTSLEQKIEEYKAIDVVAAPTTVPELESKQAATAKGKKEKLKAAKKEKKSAKALDPTWTPKAWPFGIGERLTLALRYGPIEGGVVTLEVLPPKIIDGVPALHYFATAQSSKMLELFYKIDNRLNTYVDLASHLPLRQEMEQSESARTGKRVVVFDQKTKTVRYFSKIIKKNGDVEEVRRDDPINFNAQDIFGAIYFYRFIEDLRKCNFAVHDRWKEWNSELKFMGEEKVYVPAGEFNTLRFGVTPRISGNLEAKGAAEIWVSNDDRRLLVKFTAKVKIGSITGELREYVPGRPITHPVPSMKTPSNISAMTKNP